jgi:hypothetical protein
MAVRSSSGRTAVAVAAIAAAALVIAAVLATTYLDVRTTTVAQTTTVLQTDTSTLTQISTVTLSPAPSTVVSTTTATVQLPSTVQTTSVACTISGEGGPVYVHLENDTSPVPSAAIDVVHLGPTVDGQSCGTAYLPALYTNSTGWVEVPGDNLPYSGSFLISFVYSSRGYNATVQIEPVTTSYVYISLPSGSVTTVSCVYGGCPTASDTMGMD